MGFMKVACLNSGLLGIHETECRRKRGGTNTVNNDDFSLTPRINERSKFFSKLHHKQPTNLYSTWQAAAA